MGQRKRREFAGFYCTALLKLKDIFLFFFLCVRWCTPGFVMGMNAYLDNTSEDQRTLIDIENLFDGHCKYPLTQDDATQRLLASSKTYVKAFKHPLVMKYIND